MSNENIDRPVRRRGGITAEVREYRKMCLRRRFVSMVVEIRQCKDPIQLIRKINPDLKLLKESDNFGTLMHYAAHYCSGQVVKHLVSLGGDIDSLNRQNSTPLIVALRAGKVSELYWIMYCNPNVLLMDDTGKNALQLLFELDLDVDEWTIRHFVRQVKSRTGSVDELAEKLISAGGNMFHAATLGDVELTKCMLDRGIDVNSTNQYKRPGSNVSVKLNDSKLMIWLINNGARVNTVVGRDDSPLLSFARRKNKEAIEFLLKNAVDPNCKDPKGLLLFLVFENFKTTTGKNLVECTEVLIRYCPVYWKRTEKHYGFRGFTEQVLHLNGINYLIEYLAMLEILDIPIINSIYYFIKYVKGHSQHNKYYKSCQRILDDSFIRKLSLLDLLAKCNLRQWVCNVSFVREIEVLCSEDNLNESYPYYYKTLMKRLTQANHMVKLENEAIQVISKIFNGDYNSCYNFARIIVDYLDECDLESLVESI